MGGSPVYLDSVVIPLVKGPKILDVGCGFGKWGYLCTSNYWQTDSPIKGARPEIVGCDGYEPNVDMCRNNGCYREVLQIVVPPLPFESESFDTVLLIELVEHLPENKALALIQEAKRVARDRVILSTPNYLDLREETSTITGRNPLDAHLSYIDRGQLRDLGFQLYGSGWTPGSRYLRGALRRVGMQDWYDNQLRHTLSSLSYGLPMVADNVIGLWTRGSPEPLAQPAQERN